MTYRIKLQEIKIYGAGKTWAAPALRGLRAEGFNIISRWIDHQACLTSPTDIHAEEILQNEAEKQTIWEFGCKEDCLACDFMFMITQPEDGNDHSGSLVELGHVTAFNKPVYIIGTCQSVENYKNSDRAWKAQSMVYHWRHITDPLEGIEKAVAHYRKNYRAQWLQRNMPVHVKTAA